MDERVSVTQQHRDRSNCLACELRDVMICSSVTAAEIAEFHGHIDDLTMHSGDAMFQADGPASGVYCIRSGFVKLVSYSRTGGQRIVRIVKRGGIAGLEAMFTTKYEHAAVAMGPVSACRIPMACFRHMLDDNPTLQWRLLEYSHQALIEAENWLSELAAGTAGIRERMARLLLRLREGDTDKIQRFGLEDFGAMLGTTPETACRVLSELLDMGLLTKCSPPAEHHCYHADIAALERLAH